jgi:hypothetical protein
MIDDRADTAGLADHALLVGPKRSTKRVSFDSCLLSTVITIAVNGDSKKETSATFYPRSLRPQQQRRIRQESRPRHDLNDD